MIQEFPELKYDLPGFVIYMKGGSGVLATTACDRSITARAARDIVRKESDNVLAREFDAAFDAYLAARNKFLQGIYEKGVVLCPYKKDDIAVFKHPYNRNTAMQVKQVCAFLYEDATIGWAIIGQPCLKNGNLGRKLLIALEDDLKPRTSVITDDMV